MGVTREEARERLREVASQPEPWPLGEAALLLAIDEYPELATERYLAYLAELAERVQTRSLIPLAFSEEEDDASGPRDALLHVLLVEEGFRGNREQYYDPRNSYLHEVIDRRRGIPITLAVVALAVARGAGLPLYGVSFPAHFLLRWQERDAGYTDLFNRGARLTREDLRGWWEQIMPGAAWDERVLAPAGDRQVLVRVLNNLKVIYAQGRRYDRAIAAVEKMLLLDPDTADHYRTLGYLHGSALSLGKAIEFLERYLALAPDAEDAEQVREHLRALIGTISRWN
jgi:regulator of sirC expression with transglutaminase-like and TPR domain